MSDEQLVFQNNQSLALSHDINASGNSNLDTAITAIADQAIRERVFPGCVVGYLRDGQSTVLPFGRLTYDSDSAPVASDTYYDVASITKSIPTSCAVLKLIEQGHLRLDDPAVTYVPELENSHRDQILIRHLLTYTIVLDLAKGMSAHVRDGLDDAGLWRLLYTSPLTAPPGDHYFYSNAPALLLGVIAERVTGKPLDALADELFFSPLQMTHTTFHPETLPSQKIAPTEINWRGQVHSQIHDEMAWALRKSGHIAGHAGMFTTAGDLLRFSAMLLGKGEYDGIRYFSPDTIKAMHTNQLPHLGKSAGLGWELNQPRFMGDAASSRTFGKTGFTGCIILVDPVANASMVLLSNRIYPQRPSSSDSINNVRNRIADIVFGATSPQD
jgi:CubicO group peptidase (beta-lactamase class C family)